MIDTIIYIHNILYYFFILTIMLSDEENVMFDSLKKINRKGKVMECNL